MTRRFITACENPRVNIIGHPLARKFGRRPPVEVDLPELFRAATTISPQLLRLITGSSPASWWRRRAPTALELAGPGGLLTGLTEKGLENALDAEVTGHLGH